MSTLALAAFIKGVLFTLLGWRKPAGEVSQQSSAENTAELATLYSRFPYLRHHGITIHERGDNGPLARLGAPSGKQSPKSKA